MKNHVTCTIPKSERFADRSPASSDHSSIISNGGPSTFKTPNPPRKLKNGTANAIRKNKPVQLFSTPEDEALTEKIVECSNKDLYIHELTEHIDELKQELNDSQRAILKLKNDNSSLELDIQNLKEDHKNILTTLKKKHKVEVEELRQIVLDVSEKVNRIKSEYVLFKEESKAHFKALLDNINTLQNLLVVLDQQFRSEVDTLTDIHQKEKENAETLLIDLENSKNLEIDNLKEQFNEAKLKLIEDFEMEILQIKENFREATILTEIQTQEKCEAVEVSWKNKVEEVQHEADAILKECQAIAEYNVIQCEIEKNKVLYDLSEETKKVELLQAENLELRNDYASVVAKRKDLEMQLSNVIVELNITRQELGNEVEDCRRNLKAVTKDRNLYELTVQKTHKTVEALKKRLLKSDRDVEQLKAELEATEGSKLEVEGRCNQLMQELEMLTELCDVIEEQNKLSLNVAEDKVLNLKEELLNKVDNLTAQGKYELNRVKQELSEAKELLHDQNIMNVKAQELIAISQTKVERVDVLEEQLVASEGTARELLEKNSQLTTVIEVMQANEQDLLKQLEDSNEKYANILERLKILEDENSQLHTTVKEQNSLIGPFRGQLKEYEIEYHAVMNEKENAKKEAEEMGRKYADILGHHNHKQKIKHLVDLKQKNFNLSEEKEKLELKIRSQARTIDQLKSELSTFKKRSKKEKENLDCANTSLNRSRIDSPGPLRELN